MSVPHPITVPRSDNRVPSPPVEPPGVNSGFFGCTVSPHSGLSVSHHCEKRLVSVWTIGGTGTEGIVPVTYHDRLGKVRLCDNDSSQLLQNSHQNAVLHGWSVRATDIAQGAIESFNVELILEGHAYAVQGSHESAMFFEMLIELIGLFCRFIEKNLGKATSVSQISRKIMKAKRASSSVPVSDVVCDLGGSGECYTFVSIDSPMKTWRENGTIILKLRTEPTDARRKRIASKRSRRQIQSLAEFPGRHRWLSRPVRCFGGFQKRRVAVPSAQSTIRLWFIQGQQVPRSEFYVCQGTCE
jgi:hypothetical protein